jgi:hypothetical protein
MSAAAAGGGAVAGGLDAQRWHEVARLRADHPGWVIIWLASAGEFRAYRRLPGARRDTAVSAATADGLVALMSQAGQDAPHVGGPGPGRP